MCFHPQLPEEPPFPGAPQLPEPIVELIKLFNSCEFFAPFFKASTFPGAAFVTILGLMIVWYERKLLARVMLRIGPLHVGRYAGILQIIADTIKLLGKESVVPRQAIRPLFIGAPAVGAFIALLLYALLPYGPDPWGGMWVIYTSDINLILIFVITAITPIPMLLAGWASRNKYALIGMVRFAFQLFAYEIPMFLALAGVIMMVQTFNIERIVEFQSFLPLVLLQPLGFVAFIITIIAEVERIPFDIPTAEQELVFGWVVEYSGAYFGLLQLILYLKMAALSILASLVYLGGWLGPAIPGVPEYVSAPFWLMVKSVLVMTFILILRGVYPRVTIDQILVFGWRVLIPMTIVNLLIVALIMPLVKPLIG